MVGELIAGRYELEELVGSGGMSSVYRAHDRMLERNVALKVLHEHYTRDEEYVERFRREAHSVAKLSHPNIVTVIDRGEQDGRQFIVFEYVEGESLKELVERSGPLPVRDAIQLALRVASALEFAHQQGLVHRDVKPQNVLLSEEGHVKVTDFGIARSLDVQGLTQTGTVMGTSNYIAPEQAQGEPVDALTDVYSLGAVLYELLTGEVPYPGENFVAVAMRHINDPVPSVLERRPDVPLRLDGVVQQAMAKDPGDRFGSMEALAAELDACRAELDEGPEEAATMVARPPRRRRPRPARETGRRRTWPPVLAALGLIAAAAIAAAVWAAFFRDSGPKRGTPSTPPPSHPIRLAGVGAYDPEGDDHAEHDSEAPLATDGNPETFWTTQTYFAGLQKSGVGLVLDAGRAVSPSSFTVATDTPGFTARIQAGSSTQGPFRSVSAPMITGLSTKFAVHGDPARYFVVWITRLAADRAHVNEVKAG